MLRIVSVVVSCLVLAAPALAEDPAPTELPDEPPAELPTERGDAVHWQGVYERSRTTSQIGLGAGIASLPVGAVGLGMTLATSMDDEGHVDVTAASGAGAALYATSVLSWRVGAAMLAGGGLRGHRALVSLGSTDSDPTAGTVAWALWGTSLGFKVASTAASWSGTVDPETGLSSNAGAVVGLGFANTATAIGAYAAGMVQMAQNRQAREVLGRRDVGAQADPIELRVLPFDDGEHRGIALAGRF